VRQPRGKAGAPPSRPNSAQFRGPPAVQRRAEPARGRQAASLRRRAHDGVPLLRYTVVEHEALSLPPVVEPAGRTERWGAAASASNRKRGERSSRLSGGCPVSSKGAASDGSSQPPRAAGFVEEQRPRPRSCSSSGAGAVRSCVGRLLPPREREGWLLPPRERPHSCPSRRRLLASAADGARDRRRHAGAHPA
jgi:hypothetical protein